MQFNPAVNPEINPVLNLRSDTEVPLLTGSFFQMLGNMVQKYLYPTELSEPEQVEPVQQFPVPGSNRSESPIWHNTSYNFPNETNTWDQRNPWNKVTNTQYWSQKPQSSILGKDTTIKI